MAYPGSDVTSRLQMPSSSTRPDPDAALVPQLGSDLSPATLRRVARLERADSPRTAASSAPADDAVSRQWNPVARCARHHSPEGCLLYTSDAADDLTRVDLGGRRIIKKK